VPEPELQQWVSRQHLIEARAHDINILSLPRLLDCLAWAYIETHIFSLWFPGLREDHLKFIAELENFISGIFTSSSTYPPRPH